MEVGTKADSAGQVPVTFRFRERPLHAVSLNGAYSTDLGGSAGVTWTHRDLTGEADQLTLSSSVLNLGGSASTGVGYDVSAKYLMPEFGHRDQSLQLAVQAINQSLQAYDQKAITFGATLNRKLSSVWTASLGVTAEVETHRSGRLLPAALYDREHVPAEYLRPTVKCPSEYACPPGVTCLTNPPYLIINGPTCTAGVCSEEVFHHKSAEVALHVIGSTFQSPLQHHRTQLPPGGCHPRHARFVQRDANSLARHEEC